jgi:surface polysaccharide O-acyltransferase-like enzyme
VLALLRLALVDRYPATHALVGDWYLHATYLGVFIVGAAWARDPAAWQRCAEMRWPAGVAALAAWGVMLALSTWVFGTPQQAHWLWLGRAAFAAMQWSAIVCALGFAKVHLNSDHRWRATLAECVFPVYIVHQTLLIAFAIALAPLRWRAALEGPLLVALTFSASLAAYFAVRRVSWLRPWFGLTAPAAPPVAAPAALQVADRSAR